MFRLRGCSEDDTIILFRKLCISSDVYLPSLVAAGGGFLNYFVAINLISLDDQKSGDTLISNSDQLFGT